MKWSQHVLTIALFANGLAAGSEQASEPANLECISEIELPRFAVANRVPEGGRVKAFILVGSIPEISVNASNPDLGAEVKYHLRDKTRYRTDCFGKEIAIEFTFRVEGSPLDSPFSIVRFRPPNQFVIITQPVKPTLDSVPVKKPAPSKPAGRALRKE